MRFTDDINEVSAEALNGFFVGWRKPLTPAQHYELLQNSTCFVAAIDESVGRVVGFVTALSDGVRSGFIPLLEVLPSYQRLGIGTELMRRVLLELGDAVDVDLTCDADVQPFYEKLGMKPSPGMILRRP